jgi:hypothetical protein
LIVQDFSDDQFCFRCHSHDSGSILFTGDRSGDVRPMTIPIFEVVSISPCEISSIKNLIFKIWMIAIDSSIKDRDHDPRSFFAFIP